MHDHVALLRRLRWHGDLPYANLRHRNGPAGRLAWRCGPRTADPVFAAFSCDWVGNWLRPGGQPPRRAADVTAMTRDAWIDSVELQAVRACSPPQRSAVDRHSGPWAHRARAAPRC